VKHVPGKGGGKKGRDDAHRKFQRDPKALPKSTKGSPGGNSQRNRRKRKRGREGVIDGDGWSHKDPDSEKIRKKGERVKN